MANQVVTFGETMIRLSPPEKRRLEQAGSFDIHIGGSESNVAVVIKRLGLDTAFVTRLPNNSLGRMVVNKTREHGVDVSNVVWTDKDRVGIYFLEFGANPRPSSVIYDRSESAISNIQEETVNWESIFEEAKLFHLSGITPALSKSAKRVSEEAMKSAKKQRLKVSVDLNYRSKLWSQQKAKKCMTRLMEYTDILITTEEDTERVFGITDSSYKKVAEKLTKEFGFEVVAITLRDNISMWRNDWTAIAYKDGNLYDDITYKLELVDRVGGGDSFTGGFLFGYLTGGVEKALKYGNATSAIKQTNPGDINWCTLEEVENLAKGGGRNRISR